MFIQKAIHATDINKTKYELIVGRLIASFINHFFNYYKTFCIF